MRLTGPQLEVLFEAILDAYPRENEFKRLLRFGVDVCLADVPASAWAGYSDKVFETIEWLHPDDDKFQVFVDEAVRRKPNNTKLKEFCDTVGWLGQENEENS